MEPPLWQCAIAVQTDPNIFFHCRPVDGATVMATKLVVGDRGRSVACWTFTGRVFHPVIKKRHKWDRNTERIWIYYDIGRNIWCRICIYWTTPMRLIPTDQINCIGKYQIDRDKGTLYHIMWKEEQFWVVHNSFPGMAVTGRLCSHLRKSRSSSWKEIQLWFANLINWKYAFQCSINWPATLHQSIFFNFWTWVQLIVYDSIYITWCVSGYKLDDDRPLWNGNNILDGFLFIHCKCAAEITGSIGRLRSNRFTTE